MEELRHLLLMHRDLVTNYNSNGTDVLDLMKSTSSGLDKRLIIMNNSGSNFHLCDPSLTKTLHRQCGSVPLEDVGLGHGCSSLNTTSTDPGSRE